MKKNLKSETCKETFAKAGPGAAKAVASRGAKPSPAASPKTKSAFTREVKKGNIKTTKNGAKITAKGKKAYNG